MNGAGQPRRLYERAVAPHMRGDRPTLHALYSGIQIPKNQKPQPFWFQSHIGFSS